MPLLVFAVVLGVLLLTSTRANASSAASPASAAPLRWPIAGGARVSQRFSGAHNGVDLAVPAWTPVLAAAAGTVKAAWNDTENGGGYSVRVEHSELGLSTGYAHLSEWVVYPGQTVEAGELLGYSGGVPGAAGAGKSTGAHLHFVTRSGGACVDPLSLLPAVA